MKRHPKGSSKGGQFAKDRSGATKVPSPISTRGASPNPGGFGSTAPGVSPWMAKQDNLRDLKKQELLETDPWLEYDGYLSTAAAWEVNMNYMGLGRYPIPRWVMQFYYHRARLTSTDKGLLNVLANQKEANSTNKTAINFGLLRNKKLSTEQLDLLVDDWLSPKSAGLMRALAGHPKLSEASLNKILDRYGNSNTSSPYLHFNSGIQRTIAKRPDLSEALQYRLADCSPHAQQQLTTNPGTLPEVKTLLALRGILPHYPNPGDELLV